MSVHLPLLVLLHSTKIFSIFTQHLLLWSCLLGFCLSFLSNSGPALQLLLLLGEGKYVVSGKKGKASGAAACHHFATAGWPKYITQAGSGQ